MGYSSRLSVAMVKHWLKSAWGEKDLFGLYLRAHHQRKSGQELRQRPWRNTAYWLDPPGLLSLPSYTRWSTVQGWYCRRQWAWPFLLSHQSRKCSTGFPQVSLVQGTFSREVPFSPMTREFASVWPNQQTQNPNQQTGASEKERTHPRAWLLVRCMQLSTTAICTFWVASGVLSQSCLGIRMRSQVITKLE